MSLGEQSAIGVSGRRGTGATPLIGRAPERERSLSILNDVAEGRARTLLIEGEAGIGKTRLVEELISEAQHAGFGVIVGRAEDLERMRPFGAIADALAVRGQAGGELGQALMKLLRDPNATEPQLIDALLDLVEERAIASPLALVIEDLHWADPVTIAALRTLQRRLAYLPILIVGTHRPHPEGPELASFLDAATREGAEVIALHPLDGAAVDEIAREMIGSALGPGIGRALAMAAGNPLYATELVRGLLDRGSLRIEDGVADADVASLPATLRLTILRRLSFLPPESIEVLRSAAVIGSSFSVDELAAVTGRDVSSVVVALAPAIASKVIRERGSQLSFRHDLIHEAIYQDIAAAVRASMHVQTAKVLRSIAVPLPRVAEQLLRGVDAPIPELIQLVTEVADALRFPAPRVAIELYERALTLAGDDGTTVRAQMKMLMPLSAVGRSTDAVARAEQMLATTLAPAVEAKIRLTRCEIKGREGHGLESVPELTTLSNDERQTDGVRRIAQAAIASAFLRAGRAAEALPLGERAVAEARAADDVQALAAGLSTMGSALDFLGMPSKAVPPLIETMQLHEDRGAYLQIPHTQLAFALFSCDRFDDAKRVIAEGQRRSQERRDLSALAPIGNGAAYMCFLDGSWDEGVVEGSAALELVTEGTGSPIGVAATGGALVQIALRRGDHDGATQVLATVRGILTERAAGFFEDVLDWSEALCFEAAGDRVAALQTCWDGWETTTMPYSITWRTMGPDLVRMLVAAGEADRARAVVAWAEEGARRADGIRSAEGAALRCTGLLADDPEILLAAVEAYRDNPRRLERALAAGDAATSLAHHGKTADARPLFAEALAFYDEVGAVWDAARATASMRAAGIRRGSKAPRKRPKTGWKALTPSEEKVARLVIEGLTNPQIAERLFVSKYTVMTHLSHIFGKLGISSRAELAAAVARETGPT